MRHRPVEDLAFAVARFVQKGGSFVNYYMVMITQAWLSSVRCLGFRWVVAPNICPLFQYHGGTNFDRTAGGPFIATSYDYDAPIDEYGTPFVTD